MSFIKNNLNKIFFYDSINKFSYENTKKITRFDNLCISIDINNVKIFKMVASLLALNVISGQNVGLKYNKKTSVFLRIKKGNPEKCYVTLRKKSLEKFLTRYINKLYLKNLFKIKNEQFVSFIIKNDNFTFKNLETNFIVFQSVESIKFKIKGTDLNLKFLVLSCLKNLQI